MSQATFHRNWGDNVDAAAAFGPVPRDVMALFDDENELNDVVEELQIVGFEHADISVSPSWKTIEKKIGRHIATVTELTDARDAPRAVPVDRGSFGLAQGACIAGPLYVFSCGIAIAFAARGADLAVIALAGAAAGAMGAALGVLPAIWLRQWHKQYIGDLLDHGGLVLWLRALDENHEQRARRVLARYAARDVHNSIAA